MDAEWYVRNSKPLIQTDLAGNPLGYRSMSGKCGLSPRQRLKQEELLRFVTCNYIHEHHNIILLRVTGSGKTYLACALGMAVARRFFAVKYIWLPDLLVEFQIASGNCTIRKLMAQYKKYAPTYY